MPHTLPLLYLRNDIYGFYSQSNNLSAAGEHLSPESLKRLNALYTPEEPMADLVVRNGTGTLTLPMRANDVWFLDIEKAR